MASLVSLRAEERIQKFKELLAFVHTATPDELVTILVRNRVKRGRRWLFRNAPSPGWWRNCLNPGAGRGSRIHTRHSEETAAALAFEYDARFTDEFGYVQTWKIMRHFFGELFWEIRARQLGFSSSYIDIDVPFPKRYASAGITSDLLDLEWAVFVENPPGDWLIQYRHPRWFDRYLAGTIRELRGCARPIVGWFSGLLGPRSA